MQEQIINTLKETYARDIRKQIVKSLIIHEKNDDKEAIESSHNILNQIFTYIISELRWKISPSSGSWDDTPLKIIAEVFPKLETTQWFKDQHINIKAK